MQRLMLGDPEADRGQFAYLTPFAQHHWSVHQRRMAMGADAGAVLDHRVWGRHQTQRVAAMPNLATRLFAAPAAQAPRLGHLAAQAVAGGRFRAVVAVFGQPCFQLLHARQQRRYLLAPRGVLGFQELVLIFSSGVMPLQSRTWLST